MSFMNVHIEFCSKKSHFRYMPVYKKIQVDKLTMTPKVYFSNKHSAIEFNILIRQVELKITEPQSAP